MVRIQRYFPPSKPIDITSDSESDEEDAVLVDDAQARAAKRLRAQQRSTVPARVPVISIDQTADDEAEPDDPVIDLTGDSTPLHGYTTSGVDIHNIHYTSPRHGDIYLSEQTLDNHDVVRAGDVVELDTPISKFHVTHLVLHHIIRTRLGARLLVGIPLGRAKEIEHWLPHSRNETCLVFEANDNNVRRVEQQALVEVKVSQARRRRTITYTNASYPRYRQIILQQGALACRWACVLEYANDAKRRQEKPRESIIHNILESQATPGFAVSSEQQRNDWRGTTVRGGCYVPPQSKNGIEVINLDAAPDGDPSTEFQTTEDTREWRDAEPGQQYTLADIFCGGGGTSCGAEQAGFKVRLACDADPKCCITFRQNFPDARLFETSITDLFTSEEHVCEDLVHLSPPCQPYSPAHTRPGARDDINTAALLGCGSLIKKLRPRIFTLEQTFGIVHLRHKVYLDALIAGFVDHGYSVRWKVAQLLDWNTAVQRRRLIMIGACPGEQLPPYPPPSHRQHRTVAQVLQRPPRSSARDKHHQPASMPQRKYAPWNAHQPLPTTITTSGPDSKYKGHYSGLRDFTPREIAVLQGFPWAYKFGDTHVKKQAGNAFPPPAVKTLYSHLREWLLQVDRVRPAASPPVDVICIDHNEPAPAPIIVISEEQDEDIVVTIPDSDSEEDDLVILDDERVFTASPSQERFSRESTGTLDGEESEERLMDVVDDIDVEMMEGGSEGAMRGYC